MPYWPSIRDLYVQEVLRDKPVGFWPLDTPAGMASPFAADCRATNAPNPGTYAGGYTLGQPGPFAGAGAVRLDGSTGYVRLPPSLPRLFGAFTIEMWVRPATLSPPNGAALLTSDWYNSPRVYEFYQSGASLQLDVGDGASGSDAGLVAGSLSTYRWTHLAAVVSGTSHAIYQDGALAGATTGNFSGGPGSSTNARALGADNFGTAGYTFGGLTSLPAFYAYALSPARIAARYAVATGRQRARLIYSIPSGVLFRRTRTNRSGSRGVAA